MVQYKYLRTGEDMRKWQLRQRQNPKNLLCVPLAMIIFKGYRNQPFKAIEKRYDKIDQQQYDPQHYRICAAIFAAKTIGFDQNDSERTVMK